jgi:hypothetical protein
LRLSSEAVSTCSRDSSSRVFSSLDMAADYSAQKTSWIEAGTERANQGRFKKHIERRCCYLWSHSWGLQEAHHDQPIPEMEGDDEMLCTSPFGNPTSELMSASVPAFVLTLAPFTTLLLLHDRYECDNQDVVSLATRECSLKPVANPRSKYRSK